MTSTLQIDGVEVRVEGEGTHTVLMLHGWPDTLALWDSTVAALYDGYRCARFCLPGYDLNQPPRALSVAAMTKLIHQIADAVSPKQPVTLLLHDWGCFFGYEFAARHPERVERVIGVDIGDTSSGAYLKSLSGKQKAMIAGYQLWLALAWKLGPVWPGLANRMSRRMARAIGCRNPPERIGWQMNYPYAMAWFGAHGGLRGAARVDHLLGEDMPALFVYGRRKPFMFHSARWIEQLAQTPGCEVLALETGHWVMAQKPLEFNTCVRAWLDRASTRGA
jgi:pimeloyl-ACP methyl ester carboxylesterase